MREMIGDSAKRKIAGTNHLGRIFWSLFDNLGITYQSFSTSLRKYVHNPNYVVQTATKRTEKTSNIFAELSCDERMSWGKFIEGLKAIEIVRFRITVEVWRGRREIYAVTTFESELSDPNKSKDSDSDDEDVEKKDEGS